MPRLFGLADCNNFYASCERVFEPALNGRPIVVLSNNDGCVIARSNEAKALGIKMGDAEFKIRLQGRQHNVVIRSSNYTLYGDMSARVMQILGESLPALEIYSIDEAFGDFTGIDDPTRVAAELRTKVRQWTGIPISIGLGPSKVLAKAGNKLAKKTALGVHHVPSVADLTDFPIRDLWGIGPAHEAFLTDAGITTAAQLAAADRVWIRRHLGVVGERLVWELNGLSCLSLEEVNPAKKNICCAKGFGQPLTELPDIQSALAAYVARVAEKLRGQSLVCGAVSVFLLTNPFRTDEPQYNPQISSEFAEPKSFTPDLQHEAQRLLARIYRSGYRFRKVGIMLLDLTPATAIQRSLFRREERFEQKARLQRAIDHLNHQYGRDAVRTARHGFADKHRLRAEKKSRCFTTRWEELLKV